MAPTTNPMIPFRYPSTLDDLYSAVRRILGAHGFYEEATAHQVVFRRSEEEELWIDVRAGGTTWSRQAWR